MSYSTMGTDLLTEYTSLLNQNQPLDPAGKLVDNGGGDELSSFDLSFLSNASSDLSTAATSAYGYSSSEAGYSTHDSPPFDLYGSSYGQPTSFDPSSGLPNHDSSAFQHLFAGSPFTSSNNMVNIAPGLTQYVSPMQELAVPQPPSFGPGQSVSASPVDIAAKPARNDGEPPAKRGRKRKVQSDTESVDQFGPVASPSAVNLIANAGLSNNIYQPEPIAASASAVKQKGAKRGPKQPKQEKGHNAVERKYRNNINNAIATLRDIIPALSHLKPVDGSSASKRKPSQFNLAGASTAPAPSGLVDGILAAKTLSKGTILCKAIEYIEFLKEAREELQQDVEMFKQICFASNGAQLVDEFERRRAALEPEREARRTALRNDTARMDGNEDDEESDHGPPVPLVSAEQDAPLPRQQQHAQQQQNKQQPDGLAQLQAHLASSGTVLPPELAAQLQAAFATHGEATEHVFPPSPVSSEDGPRATNGQGRSSRTMFAAFAGASFAGGLGLDLASAGAASETASWASSAIVKRGLPVERHSTLVAALVFVGLVTFVSMTAYLVFGMLTRSRANDRTTPGQQQPAERSTYRAQRRKAAIDSLRAVQTVLEQAKTYGDSCKAGSLARKELLRLVGAPTYGLLPKLAKEFLATALRKVTTIRVGSFSRWSEEERCEAAAAWVRIAEIEIALGDDVNYLARCYTFLRLFNLSRSKHWPETTSSTARPTVDAVLALHLASLGHALSASRLWKAASTTSPDAERRRKKTDVELDAWTELALSTDFAEARRVALLQPRSVDSSPARTSDTVPLLRIAESKIEASLSSLWQRLFVEMAHRKVDASQYLDELESIEASTVQGSRENAMALMTIGVVCAVQGGDEGHRRRVAGLAKHLSRTKAFVDETSCASLFFAAVVPDASSLPSRSALAVVREPATLSDAIATVALGSLVTNRLSAALAQHKDDGKTDRSLHALTLDLRRLMSDDSFVRFSAQSDEDSKWEAACDEVLDGFVRSARQAAGLDTASDSGIEL